MPDAMTGVTDTTSTTPTASTPQNALGQLDKDMFLKLMVAQLKYQNPMSPSDPAQFMAQTAQFTMVEKLDAISKSQTDLATWQRSLVGTQLLGHQVTGTGPGGSVVQGVVTGLTLGSAGAQLQLAGGGTLPVEAVTSVVMPSTGPATTSKPPPTTGSAPSPAPAAPPPADPAPAPSDTAPSDTAPGDTALSDTAPSAPAPESAPTT